MAHFNGTLRKAIITASVTLIFGVLTYLFHNTMTRLNFLESETYRIGKIAAGRGERLDKLEAFQSWANKKLVDLEIEMAREHRMPPRRY